MSEEAVNIFGAVAVVWMLAIGTVAIVYGLVTDISDRRRR